MVCRWVTPGADESVAAAVAADSGVPLAAARVLAGRGLTSRTDIERFLDPCLSSLCDPFELPGVSVAVERLWRAIDGSERIVVYGDYDADGVVGTALAVSVLRKLGASVEPWLPRRVEDGYGLSESGLARCMEAVRPSLIVTVDCGTSDGGAVAKAAAAGADCIVVDHHEIGSEPSKPLALVNPKLMGDRTHGARVLSGAGVAFKLCHALLKSGRDNGRNVAHGVDLREYLPLVAAATVADMAPLTGENRIIVRHGLDRMPTTGNVGLRALMEAAGLRGTVRAHHLGFVVGPRLNAAGRLGDAGAALELLLTTDAARAQELARKLEGANQERRAIEQELVEVAMGLAGKSSDPSSGRSIVVSGQGWHQGVIGLVAARLVSKYYRPAVVVSLDDTGMGKGSCRSIPEFDMVAGLAECSDCLVAFGGHGAAAGLSERAEMLEEFRLRFEQVCVARLKGQQLTPSLTVDCWLGFDEVNDSLWDAACRMQPFGQGNPLPVWACEAVNVSGRPRVLKGDHLRMTLVRSGTAFDAIGFGMAGRTVPEGPIDVAFALDRSSYTGELELKLKDFRPSATRPDQP